MMPAGGGVRVLKNLRVNVNTFNIPVIAITGINDKQIIEATVELGISGYFVKPIDMDKLLEKIEEVLIKK
jgi:two-component system response regulator (stage 0 sporulation protein A)